MSIGVFVVTLLLSVWIILHGALALHHMGSDETNQIARSFGHTFVALVSVALLIWFWK